MKKEETILEQLQQKMVDEAYQIAISIRDDLWIKDEHFHIRDTNEDNILDGNYVSVQFTRLFAVSKSDYEKFLEEVSTTFKEHYISESQDKGDFVELYLDVDSEIDLEKTIIENKKSLMEIKGLFEFLCGKYSYLV